MKDFVNVARKDVSSNDDVKETPTRRGGRGITTYEEAEIDSFFLDGQTIGTFNFLGEFKGG